MRALALYTDVINIIATLCKKNEVENNNTLTMVIRVAEICNNFYRIGELKRNISPIFFLHQNYTSKKR